MLEALSNLFYNPLVFWGLPLVIVVVLAVFRHRRRGILERDKSQPCEHCPGKEI